MITDNQKDIAQWVMNFAINNGCTDSRVSIMSSIDNSFEYRNSKLDQISQSSENKLFIELYIEGKYGSCSTNRLDKDELQSFILDNIQSTKFLAEDKFQQLPEPSRYFSQENAKSLENCDPYFFNIPTQDKIELLNKMTEEAFTSQKVLSVSSSYSDSIDSEYMIASNGLEIDSETTSYSITTESTLTDRGSARLEGYWYDNSMYWDDLKKKGIGKEATKRALMKIGHKKAKSGKYSLIVDSHNTTRFLSSLLGAASGAAIQQKNSFLLNKLGEKITSNKLNIFDRPHLSKAIGARWCDGEGVATFDYDFIKDGILNMYYINTYYANKMNVAPTIAGPSHLQLAGKEGNLDSFIKSTTKGIWVNGFNGGNMNPTTGDFSYGIEGFLIENGNITHPISEMNITGNILSLLNQIEGIGTDTKSVGRWDIPSLLFTDVNFSGL